MPQYLLSVITPTDGTPPTPERLAGIRAQLDALNDEMRAAGAWVFAGGLDAPATATVLRSSGGEVVATDGPFMEAKEYLGGFTIAEAGRPRRGHAVGRADRDDHRAADRGPPVHGAVLTEVERVFRAEHGRAVSVLVRVFGDIDVAEDAVAEAFAVAVARWPDSGRAAEPRGLDHHDRPPPGDRPAAARGVARRPARRGRAAARARRARRPTRTRRARCATTACA